MNIVACSAIKNTRDTKPGIRLYQFEDGSIQINEILPNGLFAQTPLRKGYELVSVNNIECRGMLDSDVMDIINNAESVVTVVAITAKGEY